MLSPPGVPHTLSRPQDKLKVIVHNLPSSLTHEQFQEHVGASLLNKADYVRFVSGASVDKSSWRDAEVDHLFPSRAYLHFSSHDSMLLFVRSLTSKNFDPPASIEYAPFQMIPTDYQRRGKRGGGGNAAAQQQSAQAPSSHSHVPGSSAPAHSASVPGAADKANEEVHIGDLALDDDYRLFCEVHLQEPQHESRPELHIMESVEGTDKPALRITPLVEALLARRSKQGKKTAQSEKKRQKRLEKKQKKQSSKKGEGDSHHAQQTQQPQQQAAGHQTSRGQGRSHAQHTQSSSASGTAVAAAVAEKRRAALLASVSATEYVPVAVPTFIPPAAAVSVAPQAQVQHSHRGPRQHNQHAQHLDQAQAQSSTQSGGRQPKHPQHGLATQQQQGASSPQTAESADQKTKHHGHRNRGNRGKDSHAHAPKQEQHT
jgi:hypothetical protein